LRRAGKGVESFLILAVAVVLFIAAGSGHLAPLESWGQAHGLQLVSSAPPAGGQAVEGEARSNPAWSQATHWGALVVVLLALLGLRRLPLRSALPPALLLLLALLALQLLALRLWSIWLPLLPSMALLAAGSLTLVAVRLLSRGADGLGRDVDGEGGDQEHEVTAPAQPAGTVAPQRGLLDEALTAQLRNIGHYRLERELGHGAMGTVHLGSDTRDGRRVAVKTVAFSGASTPERLAAVREHFFHEAETAGRLHHPHIVRIHEVDEEGDIAYIAMDYLEGEPLSRYTEEGSLLPVERVFDIAVQVAEALDYAHQMQVIHRDIKPANIIYNARSGVARVTDFGVAVLADSGNGWGGAVFGSPSYMSPEQLAGKLLDGRSDLYALGVTLYQLLTGRLPFVADSLAALTYKITNDPRPDVRMLRPRLPACAATIIDRCLSKEVAQRVQSGHRLANALRRCRAQLEPTNDSAGGPIA